jgi:hypothetical protein
MIDVLRLQTFFAIIGLPSSGTTMIANLFNSSENTTCAMEPLLNEAMNGDGFKTTTPDAMIERIACNGECSHLAAFGVKETWAIDRSTYAEALINCDYLDLSIFVFRDPICLFNSWTKHGGLQNPLAMFNNYQAFFDLFFRHREKHNCVAIIHERACIEGLEYLNKQFRLWFKFDSLLLAPQRFGMGNERANAGGLIEPPDMDVSRISEEQRWEVGRMCNEIYKLAGTY